MHSQLSQSQQVQSAQVQGAQAQQPHDAAGRVVVAVASSMRVMA
ncbi:hypothetical protein ACFPN1_03775 [Lysobacter yangpyeongensis]|uniref:Uncharacterized protein n=1 Tax=Lysobacter yangpyeongensis TaxID=346182 RepID=A0ABW0SKP1_9GAMM